MNWFDYLSAHFKSYDGNLKVYDSRLIKDSTYPCCAIRNITSREFDLCGEEQFNISVLCKSYVHDRTKSREYYEELVIYLRDSNIGIESSNLPQIVDYDGTCTYFEFSFVLYYKN